MGDGYFSRIRVSRRDILHRGAVAAVTLAVVGLAGCGDSGKPWYKDFVAEPGTSETPTEETVIPP